MVITAALLLVIVPAWAEEADEGEQETDDAAELAQKLANPVASMISIPIQANYDQNIGPNDKGSKLVTNIQPVIPMEITDDWNLISRVIVPVVGQWDIPVGEDQFGLGDVLATIFFSPKKPTSGGLIWGVGPAMLFPTATDDFLGGKQWAAGPSAIVLTQRGPLTMGVLANHIWSYYGSNTRDDISNTFVQPILSYTSPTAFGVALTSETTYNWETENWSVPLNLSVSQMVPIGKMPVSFQAGVRYWADSPENGPEGWGFRVAMIMVLPK